MTDSFKAQVARRAPLAGTFVKSASPDVVELLGYAGLDFAVLDAEHAPFGVAEIGQLVLAARATALPCLVRLPTLQPALCGQMLDLGATGIVVPHVADAETARAAVAEIRFKGGRRGISPSTRAARFGFMDAQDYAVQSDRDATLWAQIEDAEALDRLDEIAAIDGIDLLFIGRADLALSLGVEGVRHPRVMEATRATADAGARHGKAVGIYVGSMAEAPELAELGVSVFACGSDQSHLAAAARQIVSAREALSRKG